MTEYIDRVNTTSYRFLHLDGDLGSNLEFNCYRGDAFNTQTGDVILVRGLSGDHIRYLIRVDIGRAIDVLAATGEEVPGWFTDNHRAYHAVLIAHLDVPSLLNIEHFLYMDGEEAIRNALGVDFELDPAEHAGYWFDSRLLYPATAINISQFVANHVAPFSTQTGDVMIVAYRFIHSQGAIEAVYLYIDLGAALRDYRSLYRIRLF